MLADTKTCQIVNIECSFSTSQETYCNWLSRFLYLFDLTFLLTWHVLISSVKNVGNLRIMQCATSCHRGFIEAPDVTVMLGVWINVKHKLNNVFICLYIILNVCSVGMFG